MPTNQLSSAVQGLVIVVLAVFFAVMVWRALDLWRQANCPCMGSGSDTA